jgi:organic hydroperoxide reductase OsmC/OhrA
MAEETTHHVTVRLARGFEFLAEFADVPNAAPLVFDEPPPLGHGRAPNAAAVLGAAVGNCLAASFAFCLRKARIEPAELVADVQTHVVRDERGRFRINSIDVAIAPEFAEGAVPRIERCEALFEDFCTVTASVRRGIPVQVTLKKPEEIHHADHEGGRVQGEGSPVA